MLDDVDEERFQRLRYVELKHGRICQLAFLGQIVTRSGIHLSGNIDFDGHSFDSYPNGIAAIIGPDAIPALGLVQIIGFVGFLELFVMKDGASDTCTCRRKHITCIVTLNSILRVCVYDWSYMYWISHTQLLMLPILFYY